MSRDMTAASDLPLFRNTDPPGSRHAAHRIIRTGRLASDMARVLDALRDHPGLSSKALAGLMGADRYMVARRLPDLRRQGLAHSQPQPDGETRWWPKVVPDNA